MGCLKGCLSSVTYIAAAIVVLVIIMATVAIISDDSSKRISAVSSSSVKKETKSTPSVKADTSLQKTQKKKKRPRYRVVATNPNGHKIFIVTQSTSKSDLSAIVRAYRAKYEEPYGQWMIHFFSNKEKALRVKKEWLTPRDQDPDYKQWVYKENVDHGAIAQWTSWDGLTLDKW